MAVTMAAVRAALAAPDFQKRLGDMGAVDTAALSALALSELAARAVDTSEVDLVFAFHQGTRRLVVTLTRKKPRRRPEGDATL